MLSGISQFVTEIGPEHGTLGHLIHVYTFVGDAICTAQNSNTMKCVCKDYNRNMDYWLVLRWSHSPKSWTRLDSVTITMIKNNISIFTL